VLIQVTQEHIDEGVRRDCEQCPVAMAILAACRAAGQPLTSIQVDGAYVSADRPGETLGADLPLIASDFIESFDGMDPVAPFCFDLEWRVVSDPEGLAQ
jgi:hypothetical protein